MGKGDAEKKKKFQLHQFGVDFLLVGTHCWVCWHWGAAPGLQGADATLEMKVPALELCRGMPLPFGSV